MSNVNLGETGWRVYEKLYEVYINYKFIKFDELFHKPKIQYKVFKKEQSRSMYI